jgi:glycosyltransferase involved in cell wall biosynthesis
MKGFGQRPAALNSDRLLNRFWFYPRFISRLSRQFDIFHIVDHSYSQLIHQLPAKRTVVTCHDLDTFRCLLEPEREPRSFVFRAMAQRILDGFRRAARIVCVSQWTRDQIIRHQLVPSERLEVVPEGVAPAFTVKPNPLADAEANRVLRGTNPAAIYLLHVSSTIPRKRVDVLLRTFAAVHRGIAGYASATVGGSFNNSQSELIKMLGIADFVTILPFLAPELLAAIYRRATLVLLPLEAEGFGLPVIEALACGTPFVASDLQVLREVGGIAAEYCPVADLQTWASTVLSLLDEHANPGLGYLFISPNGADII